MRQSQLVFRTLRDTPKEASTLPQQLLLRGGFIRQSSAGVYLYGSLFDRVVNRLAWCILRRLSAQGYDPIRLPILAPVKVGDTKDSATPDRTAEECMVADGRGTSMRVTPGPLEVVAAAVRNEVGAAKDLPRLVQTAGAVFRDEQRPRYGLIRSREYFAHYAFSFYLGDEDDEGFWTSLSSSYRDVLTLLSIPYREIEALREGRSHAYFVPSEANESAMLYCESCGYQASEDAAESRLRTYPQDDAMLAREDVFGEGLIGVEPLAEFLRIPVWKTTKTLLFQADDRVVAVMVRGDSAVNERKLQRFLQCRAIKLASAETIKRLTGAEVGYAGPLGLPEEVLVLADTEVAGRVNFECGANRTDYHTINVNFGRDLPVPPLSDLKLAKAGDGCPRCETGVLQRVNGVEVGHVTCDNASVPGWEIRGSDGAARKVSACYAALGLSRLVALVVEHNCDSKGIRWPRDIAPFDVHLVCLNLEDPAVRGRAEQLYTELQAAGVEVLFDDREVRAGEKFGDSDLLGIPLRVTLSKRGLAAGTAEIKDRSAEDATNCPLESVAERIVAERGLR